MWFERFDIIVINLSHDRLPSSWAMFSPTFIDIGIYVGTIGFFFVLFLLYARTFPVIAQAEVKTILKSSGANYKRLRAEYGDDVSHVDLDPTAIEPSSHTQTKYFKSDEETKDQGEDHSFHRGTSATKEEKSSELAAMLDRIGHHDPETEHGDNLSKIEGLSRVMEHGLNDLGIYTYDQVSKLEDRDYDLIDSVLEIFSASIAKKEDMAAQALNLKNE